MPRSNGVETLSPAAFAAGLARTPMDQYVIWDGARYAERPGSLCSRTLRLVTEVWTPVALRDLILRAAALDGGQGFSPDAVRAAVRQHQSIRGAAYFLVRRTREGEFVAVSDIPWPTSGGGPIRCGQSVTPRRDSLAPADRLRRIAC